jgi:hypothetical protein
VKSVGGDGDREAKAAVADEVALAAQAPPADGTEETARMATTVCPAGPAMADRSLSSTIRK